MSLALSKVLDPADFDELAPVLATVDRHFMSAAVQHPMRRWEYAMALRAIAEWDHSGSYHTIYDVGGAGSPFAFMVPDLCRVNTLRIIDPDLPEVEGPRTLAQEIRENLELGDAVVCLSVLEHVDDLDEFCYHLSCLVAPGGLLFLTADYCDQSVSSPIDTYHFHWMRKRIFNAHTWQSLMDGFLDRDFRVFGPSDPTWHGPQVYDYSFVSLALVKRA